LQQYRPIANIDCVSNKRRIDPIQRLNQSARPRLAGKATARHVLHEAVDEKERPLSVARHQRIGGEIIGRLVKILCFSAGDLNIEEGFRDFFRRKPSEPLKELPAALAQLRD
jgi:hypothetical protein